MKLHYIDLNSCEVQSGKDYNCIADFSSLFPPDMSGIQLITEALAFYHISHGNEDQIEGYSLDKAFGTTEKILDLSVESLLYKNS